MLSPKIYDFLGIVASHPTTYKIIEPVTGIEVEKQMNRYFFTPGQLKIGKTMPFIADTHYPTDSQKQIHFALQTLMNHCINAAEAVNCDLKSFILVTHSTNEDDRIKIAKMDFMGLRNIFSKYIKKYSRTKEIEGYENNKAISELTKVFHQFIGNRNIFTHGQLGLDVKKGVFCIKFFNGRKEDYGEVDITILKSFIETGKEIKNFINKLILMHFEDLEKGQQLKGNLPQS